MLKWKFERFGWNCFTIGECYLKEKPKNSEVFEKVAARELEPEKVAKMMLKDKWIPYSYGRYYTIILDFWKIGREHMWYDGPHDSLHLGFLHLYWSLNCKKCGQKEFR